MIKRLGKSLPLNWSDSEPLESQSGGGLWTTWSRKAQGLRSWWSVHQTPLENEKLLSILDVCCLEKECPSLTTMSHQAFIIVCRNWKNWRPFFLVGCFLSAESLRHNMSKEESFVSMSLSDNSVGYCSHQTPVPSGSTALLAREHDLQGGPTQCR